MKVAIQIYPTGVFLEVGHGVWAGTQMCKLWGDGEIMAKQSRGDWRFNRTLALAFADWIDENASEMKSNNQFREIPTSWWTNGAEHIRHLATTNETPLPKWA